MAPLEIEVKFFLPDVAPLRQRILDLGACSRGRFFESNKRFEDPHNSLYRNRSLLRLRQDRKTTLTFKSEPARKDSEFKIFRELEVEVSDFETMHQMLTALGWHPAQLYEKWRETLLLSPAVFCIDSMPFGNFLEIEGPKESIRELADRLELKWEKRILENYLSIFELLKKNMDLPFSDLTFDNFNAVSVDMGRFLPQLEAGA